jgi:hypothetical protein
MCTICLTSPRGGMARHMSTKSHRLRAQRSAALLAGDRIARGQAWWNASLRDWDRQYDPE